MDPFSQSSRGVGVPNSPSYPSKKVMAFVRGTGVIGSGGLGFLLITPTVANDMPTGYVTKNGYASSVINGPAYNTANGGSCTPTPIFMPQLPYDNSTLLRSDDETLVRNLVESRVISCSAKLMYTGTDLNMSGQYYVYGDQNGDTISGQQHSDGFDASMAYSIDTLSTFEATEIMQANRKGAQILILPPNHEALDYTKQNYSDVRRVYPFSVNQRSNWNGIYVGAPANVIAITGVAGQPFYYEIVTHIEYVGTKVPQSEMTENLSDVVGMDIVNSILSRAQRRIASGNNTSLKSCIIREMQEQKVHFGSGKRTLDG